jgi:hypothetical protein
VKSEADAHTRELAFRQRIFKEQYHSELLTPLCQFLVEQGYTGVYVAELDYPRREYSNEQDDDE